MLTIDTQNMSNSVIERNKSIITKFPYPVYNRFHQNWRIGQSFFYCVCENIVGCRFTTCYIKKIF